MVVLGWVLAVSIFSAEAYSCGISADVGEHDWHALDDLPRATASRSVMLLALAVAPRYFVPGADPSPTHLPENGWNSPETRSRSHLIFETKPDEMNPIGFVSKPFASDQVSAQPVPTQHSHACYPLEDFEMNQTHSTGSSICHTIGTITEAAMVLVRND